MEAGFLNGQAGPVFYVLHLPGDRTPRGSILFVPPLAEEMNKSRRMVNLQARRMAQAGFAVLVPDLYGCGDSCGDFADGAWDTWLEDLLRCSEYLDTRAPSPRVIWALRAGCLLATELLARRDESALAALLWAPVTNGEQHLTQFLRLRMAAGLMGGQKESTKALRARLQEGEALEVAGYTLSPALAERLAAARLGLPRAASIAWFEVAAENAAAVAPASERTMERWQAEGAHVRATVVGGEAFWSTQDILEVPGLLDATMESLKAIA